MIAMMSPAYLSGVGVWIFLSVFVVAVYVALMAYPGKARRMAGALAMALGVAASFVMWPSIIIKCSEWIWCW